MSSSSRRRRLSRSDLPPRLLEVYKVAYRLERSPAYVRRLLRDGKLAAIRLGTRWRIDPADLQAFVERERVEPPDVLVNAFGIASTGVRQLRTDAHHCPGVLAFALLGDSRAGA